MNQRKIMDINKLDALIFDFDGVLTDNKVYIGEDGKEVVSCSRSDGLGFDVLRKLKKPILFNNVSYCYQDEKVDVLKNITLSITNHKMTAIVGPSGSGKSTLIDLLPRLRDPNNGSISINGKNIERYKLKSLRQSISYTPQSPQIFDGTVKDHILYGKANATADEINKAIDLSGSNEFVYKLPKGIDTILGEDATKLSGGQRQRLDLARSLVGDGDCLILDEPNSNFLNG